MNNRILLIDDDEDLLRSFQVILEAHGYDVFTLNDTSNCFTVLRNFKPDVLVLDVMMNTDLEGFELLQALKKDAAYRDLPVILLTGIREQIGVDLFSTIENESLFPKVRCQDKPVSSQFLMEMIRNMLNE
jgi:DNA-binding response OmpR family regulator